MEFAPGLRLPALPPSTSAVSRVFWELVIFRKLRHDAVMVKVHAKAKEDEKQDENKPDDWCWIEAAVHHYLLLASFRIETSICFDPCIYYSLSSQALYLISSALNIPDIL